MRESLPGKFNKRFNKFRGRFSSSNVTGSNTKTTSRTTATTVAVNVEEVKKKIDVNGASCVIISNNSADNPDGKMLVDYYKEYCNGNLKFLTYSYEDLAIKLQASELAGNPPDVYSFRNQDFPQLLYKSYLEPLNSHIDFTQAEWQNVKSTMDNYSWSGNYYLVPSMSTSPLHLVQQNRIQERRTGHAGGFGSRQ